MARHRKFNADRFLDKFQGSEKILHSYVALWPECAAILPSGFTVDEFKNFLGGDDVRGKDDLVEGLYRCYDLSTEDGHEYLHTACEDNGCCPDPEGNLPVECYALQVLTEEQESFQFAYDMRTVSSAEKFALYKGKKGQEIAQLEGADTRLHTLLTSTLRGGGQEPDTADDRVIVRHFRDEHAVNFVIYHEKRTQAHLTFKRGKGARKRSVAPLVFRPVQQDLICYDSTTGTAEIETRTEKDEAILRRAFASCCLGEETLFEGDDSIQRLDFAPVQNENFVLHLDEGHSAAVVELHMQLRQRHGPSIMIKSKDALETVRKNHIHWMIASGIVRKVVVKFDFGDDGRGRRVEIALPNRLKFNRATHANDVFRYLRRWRLMRD